MGQQQLLLLVLATVIVGLATVAGIQAFDENQEQATQDALTQRGIDIVTEIKGAANKPSQFGGLDWSGDTPSTDDVAQAASLNDGSATGIPAEGAGNGATCDIDSFGGSADAPTATVLCETASEGDGLQVTVELEDDGEITTTQGDDT